MIYIQIQKNANKFHFMKTNLQVMQIKYNYIGSEPYCLQEMKMELS